MEAFIRVFRNHCTAMVVDVDSRAVIIQRSFSYTPNSTTAHAFEWLAERDFAKDAVQVYDWTSTDDGRLEIAV